MRLDVLISINWCQNRIIDLEQQAKSYYEFLKINFSGYAPGTCNYFTHNVGPQSVNLEPPKHERSD